MRKLKCISKEFQIWEAKRIWSKDICNFVVEEFEKKYKDAGNLQNVVKLDYENENPLKKNLIDRGSKRLDIESLELADLIWGNLDFSVLKIEGQTPIGINKSFRIYKYFINDEFIEHKDMSTIVSDEVRSLYSILIYLNDNFTGGNTKFNDFEIKPTIGNLVTFPHNQLHSGEKIISGIKYILRSDVMFKIIT